MEPSEGVADQSRADIPDKEIEREKLVREVLRIMDVWDVVRERDIATTMYMEEQLNRLDHDAMVLLMELIDEIDTEFAKEHFLSHDGKERRVMSLDDEDTEDMSDDEQLHRLLLREEEEDNDEDDDEDEEELQPGMEWVEEGDAVTFSLVDNDEVTGIVHRIGERGITVDVRDPGEENAVLIFVPDGKYWLTDAEGRETEVYMAPETGTIVAWFYKNKLIIGEVTQLRSDQKTGSPNGDVQVKRRDTGQTTLVRAGTYFKWDDDAKSPSEIARFMETLKQHAPPGWIGEVSDEQVHKSENVKNVPPPEKWDTYKDQLEVWMYKAELMAEKKLVSKDAKWRKATFWEWDAEKKLVKARVHDLGTGEQGCRMFRLRDVRYLGPDKPSSTPYKQTGSPYSYKYSTTSEPPGHIAGVPREKVGDGKIVLRKTLICK